MPNFYTEFTKETADGSCPFKFFRSYANLEEKNDQNKENAGIQGAEIADLAVHRARANKEHLT